MSETSRTHEAEASAGVPLLPEDLSFAVVDPKAYADQARTDEAFKKIRADYPVA